MKLNHNNDHDLHNPPHALPVRFEFTDPEADSVSIAGTFNNWQAGAKPMHPVGKSRWVKETLLPPGTYEYCLVVNGAFRPDPAARQSVANPFGGRNSVLKVSGTPAKTWAGMGAVRHLTSGLVGAMVVLLLFQSGPFSVRLPRFFGGHATAAAASSTAPTSPSQAPTFCNECAKPASFVVQFHGINAWQTTTNGNIGHEITILECKSCGHQVTLERQVRNLALTK